MSDKDKWHVIGRDLAGWHADAGGGTSSSGGQLDPYTYWTGEKCSGYLAGAVEGCLVYDAKHLEGTPADSAFARHVYYGPMVDPSLPPDGVSRFGARATAAFMAPALGGSFQTYALLAQDENFTGLDYVGVAVFEALLRRIPGIKIGHVRGGVVVWDEPEPLVLTHPEQEAT